MDDAISIRTLLGAPVRLGNLTIGRVDDVVLSRELGSALGVSVSDRKGRVRFVPWAGIGVERARVRVLVPSLVSTTMRHALDEGARSAARLLTSTTARDVFLRRDGAVSTVIRSYDCGGGKREAGHVLVTLTAKRTPTAARAA